MAIENINVGEVVCVGMSAVAGASEQAGAKGWYNLTCYDDKGMPIWTDRVDNVVCTLGKNATFAAALQGSSYTVTGPYMLLISSASFSAVSAADTMASHSGWLEAGSANAPMFSGTRPTVSFNAPSSGTITSSGTISYAITGTGTIQGIAMTFGTGATSAIANTGGTLLSAGTLGTAQPVINGNTVVATYTLTM